MILTEGGARRGFELLDASGLLADILPEVAAMKGVEQPPEFHPEGDVWIHTLIMLEGLRHPSPALALGVLLHDVGKPGTFRVADRIRFDGHVELGEKIARDILNRLRFSNAEIDQVIALIANHMRFMHVPEMRESTLKRMLRMDRVRRASGIAPAGLRRRATDTWITTHSPKPSLRNRHRKCCARRGC